jgi:hypothetical protein
MKYLNKENIIIGLLVLVFAQGFFSNPFEYDSGALEYQLKITKLTEDKINLMDSINGYETKINNFKHEKSKIDSLTNNYTDNQVDSFFSNFFRQ